MVRASMPPRGRDEGEEKQIQQVEATAADETGREWPDFYLLISRVRELLSLFVYAGTGRCKIPADSCYAALLIL